jgi:DNA polymerase III epsilon subunit-like protein
MLYNSIICFDVETTSLDKTTNEIWQIGAVAIRPRDLTLYNTHFDIKLRVLDEAAVDPESLAISKVSLEQIQDEGVDPKEGWLKFRDWAAQFNMGGKPDLFNAPIMAGHNIINFDMPIYERYCYKYKTLKKDKKLGKEVPGIFNGFKHYDVLQMMSMWTENLKEPRSLALVNLRQYFGMPQSSIDKAHDALQDVRDTAAILVKLLKMTRSIAPKIPFKDCFARAAATTS